MPPRRKIEIVVALAELRAADLQDAQLPARDAILGRFAAQAEHAMRDALHLQVVHARGAIIQKQHRANSAPRKTA